LHLKRVVLENIKGFGKAELDFCPEGSTYPGWAVVTGDNGSGKTALLRAIALAIVGPTDARQLLPDLRGWVTFGKRRGTISVEIKPDNNVDKTEKGGYPVQSTFWAEVALDASNSVPTIDSTDVYRKKRKGAANGPWSPSTAGWFTVAYGPFRRLYGTSSDAQRVMMIPGRVPRFGTLFREDATLGEAEQWIKDLEYASAVDSGQAQRRALENLLALIRDQFLRHGVAVEEIKSDSVWLRDVAGRRLQLGDMSEGYRSALAMLLDLYRHMVDVYGPAVVRRDKEGRYIVDKPGLVLIDEVDSHLHPDWQRDIGFWLKTHFPNVQFIVTSHSPLVCPAADGGRIYHLPQPDGGPPFRLKKKDYEAVIAGKPDEILLTPAFGLEHTRSPYAVSQRERHALLVSKRLQLGLSAEEQAELKQLSLFVQHP
jgi:AAA domain, putative AbiEii toxin, Type IV TA system/AAA domain